MHNNLEVFKAKIDILTRLIKHNLITLEEVLVLLSDHTEIENSEVALDEEVSSNTIFDLEGSVTTTYVDGSTWNSTVSYAQCDHTLTI